jgi:hypothetical protein
MPQSPLRRPRALSEATRGRSVPKIHLTAQAIMRSDTYQQRSTDHCWPIDSPRTPGRLNRFRAKNEGWVAAPYHHLRRCCGPSGRRPASLRTSGHGAMDPLGPGSTSIHFGQARVVGGRRGDVGDHLGQGHTLADAVTRSETIGAMQRPAGSGHSGWPPCALNHRRSVSHRMDDGR